MERIQVTPSRQQGAVLLVGLVLLLIMMLGAVSMMSSSVQDERMSGNTRRGADAFMAAEAGMKHSLYVLDEGRWFGYVCPPDEGESLPSGYTEASGILQFPDSNSTETPAPLIQMSDYPSGSTGALYTVSFKASSEDDCKELDEANEDLLGIKAVRMVSVGVQAGSSRTIEFMAGHSKPSWPALFINDNGNCSFESGTSNNFLFDGNGGAVIGANSRVCQENIENDIESVDRRDNYDGEIINHNPAPEFTLPAIRDDDGNVIGGLQAFYNAALAADAYSNDVTVVNAAGEKVKGLDNTLDKNRLSELVGLNGGSLGSTANLPTTDPDFDPATNPPVMKTTVVQGNLDITGSISGAGILLVTGTANFGGTPDWDGIIMVLGGQATIGGGGTSSTGFEGTMIVSNIDFDGSATTANDPANPGTNWEEGRGTVGSEMVEWDVSGGGGGNYRYYCDYVKSARAQLKTELESGSGMTEEQISSVLMPEPDCSRGNGEGTLGKAHIIEWYEVVNE